MQTQKLISVFSMPNPNLNRHLILVTYEQISLMVDEVVFEDFLKKNHVSMNDKIYIILGFSNWFYLIKNESLVYAMPYKNSTSATASFGNIQHLQKVLFKEKYDYVCYNVVRSDNYGIAENNISNVTDCRLFFKEWLEYYQNEIPQNYHFLMFNDFTDRFKRIAC